MSISHGSLENTILNAIWYIEENRLSKEITVNEVYEMVQRSDSPRAYTTIKTVMDRLAEKNILTRTKKGKKFSYETTKSRNETAHKAILKLANTYFNNDLGLLHEAVQKVCNSSKMYV